MGREREQKEWPAFGFFWIHDGDWRGGGVASYQPTNTPDTMTDSPEIRYKDRSSYSTNVCRWRPFISKWQLNQFNISNSRSRLRERLCHYQHIGSGILSWLTVDLMNSLHSWSEVYCSQHREYSLNVCCGFWKYLRIRALTTSVLCDVAILQK